ncbi:nucleotide exchange factor GrpE [Estrella lausannensis]|uniref:Protein GrpE n=1 Tax=Estrella lausannensis TaxID=483423 RepID=A0A0H5DR38_9BACT|nr:nucleotide exchange factor GrpE [Estrella lausannensis]CRX39052.1 Protein GrpE [Estrella lausannensis]
MQDQENLKMTKDEAGNQEEPATSEKKRIPVSMHITDIELEELQKEARENKDKYLRILAESENARKRLIKEKQEQIQYALQNVVCDFLAPIDQLEMALKHSNHASTETRQWVIGFEMILAHFKDALAANNVYPYVSVGTAFDAHLHEAVEMVVTAEHPEGIVVEESLKGYKMGDRVIRPARVKVSKSPEQKEENSSGS